MSVDAPREQQVNRLRVELDRLCSTPLGRCPACRRPVRFEEPYVRVNDRYVHAACARLGVYEEVPAVERTDATAA
jgi:hypothetical protein